MSVVSTRLYVSLTPFLLGIEVANTYSHIAFITSLVGFSWFLGAHFET